MVIWSFHHGCILQQICGWGSWVSAWVFWIHESAGAVPSQIRGWVAEGNGDMIPWRNLTGPRWMDTKHDGKGHALKKWIFWVCYMYVMYVEYQGLSGVSVYFISIGFWMFFEDRDLHPALSWSSVIRGSHSKKVASAGSKRHKGIVNPQKKNIFFQVFFGNIMNLPQTVLWDVSRNTSSTSGKWRLLKIPKPYTYEFIKTWKTKPKKSNWFPTKMQHFCFLSRIFRVFFLRLLSAQIHIFGLHFSCRETCLKARKLR